MKDPRDKVDDDATDPSGTRGSLLERLRAGDSAGWREFDRLYRPLIETWCRRLQVADQDVADIAQEVMQAVHAGLERFKKERPGDRFRGWLWTITHRRVMDLGRRPRDRPVSPVEIDQWTTGNLASDPTADESPEINGVYRRALAMIEQEFAPKTWSAFWQVVVDERRPADVAADLQLTVNGVYIARSRVLSRLRHYFAGMLDEIMTDGSGSNAP